MSLPPTPQAALLVVQHNALVNARFRMSANEMRLFLALLSRINRDDEHLGVHRIPVRELCPTSKSHSLHEEVREMLKGLLGRFVLIEDLGPQKSRYKRPNLLGRPLMGTADYLETEGVIRASFNEHMRPYLLELTNGFFTKAHLEQLLKLKLPAAHRIYWLLREAAAMGRTFRTIGVTELRELLGFTTEYADRFDRLRTRVLDVARAELDQTDLAFTYETITEHRAVTHICFKFGAAVVCLAPPPPVPVVAPEATPAPAPGSWQALLLDAGVSSKSLAVVAAGLDAGTYPEGYLRYVVATLRQQAAGGQVRKLGGAVFKAITEGYLADDYRRTAAPVRRAVPAPNPARRLKLEGELTDARKSLSFIQTASVAIYPTAEGRAVAVAEVTQRIKELEVSLAAF